MTLQPFESFQKRLKRRELLILLIQELETDAPVVNCAQVRSAISRSEWENYETQRRSDLPKYCLSVKDFKLLTKYNKLLRTADFRTVLAERREPCLRPGIYKSGFRQSLHQLAESAYERAYEILSDCPFIWGFLDRPVNFTFDEWPELAAEFAPRLKGSTSGYCLHDDGAARRVLQSFRLTTAKDSLHALDYPVGLKVCQVNDEFPLLDVTDGNQYSGFGSPDFEDDDFPL